MPLEDQLQQLFAQFPALRQVHHEEFQNARARHLDLRPQISTRYGDADLLFTIGHDHEPIRLPSQPGMVATRYDYCRVVDTDGQLSGILDWQEPVREHQVRHVRDVFTERHGPWAMPRHNVGGAPVTPFQSVKDIIWVSRLSWAHDQDQLINLARLPRRRKGWIDTEIILYQAPLRGWRRLYQTSSPLNNVRLRGWQVFEGPVETVVQDPFYWTTRDLLERLADEFHEHVWDGGMYHVRSLGGHKVRGTFGDVTAEITVADHETQLRFERHDARLQLTMPEAGSRPTPVAFTDIDATMDQTVQLLHEVASVWDATPMEERSQLFSIILD